MDPGEARVDGRHSHLVVSGTYRSGTTFVDKVSSTTGSQLAVGTIIPVASTAGFYVGQDVAGTGID